MYQGRFEPGVQRNHSAPQTAPGKNQTQRTAGASQSQQRAASQQRTAQSVRQAQPIPRKKGPRVGGMIFYTLYFMMIGVFALSMFLGLRWLDGWLIAYEASQPTTKSQEVFDELFAAPDWGKLYELSGAEDTPYEGKDQYAAYMAEKVGSTPLTFTETSAGTSGDKKYLVRMGDTTVASFTLSGQTAQITDIPDWNLGKVELVFDRASGYLIQKLEGHTAYVNGAPLDDSFTIQIATTKAEEYLPIGTSGVRTCIQQIEGLMLRPTVTINDQNGNPVEVDYDETAGMFVEKSVGGTIPDDLRERVTGAAEAYGKYLGGTGSNTDLRRYFETSGNAYKEITKADRSWTKTGVSQKIMNETVSEYTRYSDTLFSARVSYSLDITRSDGSIKSNPVDATFFFTLTNNKWMVYEMTNEEVQIPVGQVRLTFKDGDTLLDTNFYATDSKELMTPVVAAPEGKVFAGWVRESIDENGRMTLDLVFTPDETGHVAIPSGATLEPMTLYAYFEDASASGEGGNA